MVVSVFSDICLRAVEQEAWSWTDRRRDEQTERCTKRRQTKTVTKKTRQWRREKEKKNRWENGFSVYVFRRCDFYYGYNSVYLLKGRVIGTAESEGNVGRDCSEKSLENILTAGFIVTIFFLFIKNCTLKLIDIKLQCYSPNLQHILKTNITLF